MTTLNLTDLLTREDINCRKTDRDIGIESLAASIKAHGLLQPIIVRLREDGKAEVIDGNRRLAAIRFLHEKEGVELPIDVTKAIVYADATDDEARELSLVANVQREGLHPIDEFEAYAALTSSLAPRDIAERFGKTEKEVKAALALGKLHPDIREAWRNLQISDETAKAFTIAPNQEVQKEVFDKLAKKGGVYPHDVKAALGFDHDANRAFEAIGLEAYLAAGGSIIEDLFGDENVLSDPDLAKRLLAEKLEKTCADLIADGWSFAVTKDSVQSPWNWPRLPQTGKRNPSPSERAEHKKIEERIAVLSPEDSEDPFGAEDDAEIEALVERKQEIEAAIDARRWKPAERAKSGCFVSVDWDGKIVIERGVLDPKTAKASATAGKPAAGEPEEEGMEDSSAAPSEKISAALELALSEQLTKAAYLTLRKDPALAVSVLIATLESYGDTPAKIRSNGAPGLGEGPTDRFETILAQSPEGPVEAGERLAELIAQSLDLRTGFCTKDVRAALLRALDPAELERASREVFDATHYFKAVKADLCHAALDEMGVDKKPRPSKKGDLALFSATAAAVHGWLPPQLRGEKIVIASYKETYDA